MLRRLRRVEDAVGPASRSASIIATFVIAFASAIGPATAPKRARAQERDTTADAPVTSPPGEETVDPPPSASSPPPRAREARRRAVDAELRDEGEPGAPRVELFAEDALGPAVGWEVDRSPRPSSVEESSEEVLDRWMDDRLREHQIGAGAVDGWYYAMRDSMRSSFRPDRGAMEAERRAGMDPLELAADELGRYAQRPQRPIDPGGHAPQTIFSRSREDEMTQDRFDERNPLHAPITWYRVELRVVQDRHGRVATVHVTRSSGMPSMDRAAIDAIRAVRLPLPPPSVVGAREAITSEWAFEVGDVATRLDTLAVVEDPSGDGAQVGALGRGVVRTSIHLLRVIDAAHPSFEERRETRRERRRSVR